MTRRPGALLCFVALSAARLALGQPLGVEFRANTFTTSSQDVPKVAALSGGGFVVVWYSDLLDGNDYGVFAQRFDGAATPLGGELRVNTFTTASQRNPAVASLSTGGFVVAWASRSQDGDSLGIFGQRFDAAGSPAGAEFAISVFTTGDQDLPSLAALSSGDFVVAWQSASVDGSGTNVVIRRFTSAGPPAAGELVVNTFTSGEQTHAAVAAAGSGDFVVVWQSAAQDSSGYTVAGQRFSSAGPPLGPEFRVNAYTSNDQEEPAVAVGANGDFVVAFTSYGADGAQRGIAARRFASSGAPYGGDFVVNSFTTSFQYEPAVAIGPGGEFVVAWVGDLLDGNIQGLIGRRFDALANPLGEDFVFNTYSTSNQCDPSLAFTSGGEFVAVWASFLEDGSNYGVYGRRNAAACPADATAPTVTAPADLVTTQTLCQ